VSYHHNLVRKAIDLAHTSEYRYRHGAILARGSKILASATNKVRNSPLIAPDDVTFHAEEMVVREYCRIKSVSYLAPMDLDDITIYIARVDANDSQKLSRPCEKCMKTLEYFGIREFVYTNELDGFSIETLDW
jgi:tRNA(Arg) A34 adenosine deaminase TadA